MDNRQLSTEERMVLIVLMYHADENSKCFLSKQSIAYMAGITNRLADKIIKYFIINGYLKVYNNRGLLLTIDQGKPFINIKDKIRKKTRIMYKTGKIKLPDYCQKCSSKEYLEIHHFDYETPDNVIMLCRECHINIHHYNDRQVV